MIAEKMPIKILFAEDVPTDAELAKRQIKKEGIDFIGKVVDTEQAFVSELTTFDPDIVVSDYSMPTFDGMRALHVARDISPNIPFIILTGSINEETAVKCMKAGANDYVLKEQIIRLPFSITEVLEKHSARLEKERMQNQLRENLEEYRDLINGMVETVWIISKDGNLLEVNDTAVSTLGYSREELLKIGLSGIDHHLEQEQIASLVRNMPKDKTQFFRTWHTAKNGESFPVEISSSLIKFQGNEVILSVGRDISERLEHEAKLRISEQKFRDLAESVDAILWEYNIELDRWTYIAPQVERILGYSPEEWVDSRFWIERIHPDDQERAVKSLKNAVRNGKDFVMDYRFITKSKKVVWLRSDVVVENINGEPGSLKGVKVNITERKRREAQIQLLSHSVEQSPVSIVITDYSGNIEYVNATFTKTTGFTFEDVEGKNPRIFKSGKQPKWFYKEMWETILSGREWHGELINKKKNKELYWEDTSISPIFDQQGKITHFVSVREDITEKKKMIEDLVKAKEKAEESDRLKSAFLANVSHEIRTPMNGIVGFLELLRIPGMEADVRDKYIDMVNKSSQRLLDTINDIIEISKIESGQIEAQYDEVDMAEIMNYHYEFFLPQTKEKGLELVLGEHLRSHEARGITDRVKVETILSNLLVNAWKYTESGHIEFGNYKDNNFLVFYVKDTGLGIPRKQLKAIFDRFIQANRNIVNPNNGVGLGLSIAKGYVDVLGGKIWVESKEAEGSSFYFKIPFKQVSE